MQFIDHRDIDSETLEEMNVEWLNLSYKMKFERYSDMMYERVMMDYQKVVDELRDKFEKLSDEYEQRGGRRRSMLQRLSHDFWEVTRLDHASLDDEPLVPDRIR